MGVIREIGAHRPTYLAPIAITEQHSVHEFDCGKEPLNAWLREHALDNEGKASRTYVVTANDENRRDTVLAYYTLAYGSVTLKEVPRRYRQGLPNPVPIMVLGRLAVDKGHAGKKIGPSLLREALQRTLKAGELAGLRAIIVHALDDDAVGFYAKYGFQVFPSDTRTLFLPVESIQTSLG